MYNDKCSDPGCDKNVEPRQYPNVFYKGQPYCNEHYGLKLWKEYKELFARWNVSEQPEPRLCYMMGRIVDEEGWKSEESYLSAARIRCRAFNFRKTKTGCEFEITRHPGAWSGGGCSDRVVQRWSLDFVERSMVLLGTRKFNPERDIDL